MFARRPRTASEAQRARNRVIFEGVEGVVEAPKARHPRSKLEEARVSQDELRVLCSSLDVAGAQDVGGDAGSALASSLDHLSPTALKRTKLRVAQMSPWALHAAADRLTFAVDLERQKDSSARGRDQLNAELARQVRETRPAATHKGSDGRPPLAMNGSKDGVFPATTTTAGDTGGASVRSGHPTADVASARSSATTGPKSVQCAEDMRSVRREWSAVSAARREAQRRDRETVEASFKVFQTEIQDKAKREAEARAARFEEQKGALEAKYISRRKAHHAFQQRSPSNGSAADTSSPPPALGDAFMPGFGGGDRRKREVERRAVLRAQSMAAATGDANTAAMGPSGGAFADDIATTLQNASLAHRQAMERRRQDTARVLDHQIVVHRTERERVKVSERNESEALIKQDQAEAVAVVVAERTAAARKKIELARALEAQLREKTVQYLVEAART